MTKKIIKTLLGIILLISLILTLISLTILYFKSTLPKIESLSDYNPPKPSQILSRDGHLLATIGQERREIVQLNAIPARIIHAFLAAEDDNFYKHKGIDYIGISRAMLANLKAGKIVQGGSTITQQVAKSLLLSNERSFGRKIKDYLLAQEIEKKFSKEDILFLYMNQVYLGRGAYGIKEAFRSYYNKELAEVTNAEAAMIAGLLVAPGRYSPHINPKWAKLRQEYVLKRMYETKKITNEEYLAAKSEDIKFRQKDSIEFKAPYFTERVRLKLLEIVTEKKLESEGLRVITTLDYRLQEIAEKAVNRGLRSIDKRQGFRPISRRIEDPIEQEIFIKKERANIIRNKSEYFTIDKEYNKIFELTSLVIAPEKIIELNANRAKQLKPFPAGLVDGEKFYTYFDRDLLYDALVTEIDDAKRVILINVAGVPGIIPESGFSWLKPRIISEHPTHAQPTTAPSKFIHVGDIIKVSLREPISTYWSQIYKDNKIKNFRSLIPETARTEKFTIWNLEQETEVQGSLLALSAETGEVLAYVGGSDYSKSKFDRIQLSKRQPGSSFKPFIYAASLEHGYTPTSILMDSPEALDGVSDGLSWKPSNYDNTFKGPITLRNSLEQSRNIPTIRLAAAVTVDKIINFSKRVGIQSKLDRDLSLSLGTFGITMSNLVSSYAIFPNGGKRIDPITVLSIKDRYDTSYNLNERTPLAAAPSNANTESTNVTEDNSQSPLRGTQVYDPRYAYIMTHLLRGVVLHGTGVGAASSAPYIGGKTGTTNNYVDAWFAGFSSQVVAGVWTGFDNNSSLGYGETGGRAALPIWAEFMRSAAQGDGPFNKPDGITSFYIDKETGEAVDGNNGFEEFFLEGTTPGANTQFKIKKNDGTKSIIIEDDYYNIQ